MSALLPDGGKRRSSFDCRLDSYGAYAYGLYLFASALFASIALAIVCRMAHGVALALSNTSNLDNRKRMSFRKRDSEREWVCSVWQRRLQRQLLPSIGQLLMKKASQVGGKTIYDFKYLFIVATVIMVLSLVLFSFLKMPKINVEKKPFFVRKILLTGMHSLRRPQTLDFLLSHTARLRIFTRSNLQWRAMIFQFRAALLFCSYGSYALFNKNIDRQNFRQKGREHFLATPATVQCLLR